jgi:hypothetical protein
LQRIKHPDKKNIDVAILPAPVAKAREDGMKFHIFRSDKDVISGNDMKEKGVPDGNLIYSRGCILRENCNPDYAVRRFRFEP